MLRPQDIIVALRLTYPDVPDFTVKDLGEKLFFTRDQTRHSIERLKSSRLVQPDRQINLNNLMECISFGLRYFYPPKKGPIVKGYSTLHDLPLSGKFVVSNKSEIGDFVWPDENGTHRGQSLTPLHENATKIARVDSLMWAYLSLVDVIRTLGPEDRENAARTLKKMLVSGGSII